MAMIDQSAQHQAALARQTAEARDAADAKQVVHVFLWTLFVFKLLTLVVLLYWASTQDIWLILTAVAWPWIVIPGVALAGPIGYRLRLRRVRRKREQLRRAEWAAQPHPIEIIGPGD